MFTSAPASISLMATSLWPFKHAPNNGVTPFYHNYKQNKNELLGNAQQIIIVYFEPSCIYQSMILDKFIYNINMTILTSPVKRRTHLKWIVEIINQYKTIIPMPVYAECRHKTELTQSLTFAWTPFASRNLTTLIRPFSAAQDRRL